MRVTDVSNQSLHLTPADDLLLQMTGKAAFQQGLIDISSQGKLLPSIAKSWVDTREGRNKVLWQHPLWPDFASRSLSSFFRDHLSQFLYLGVRFVTVCSLSHSVSSFSKI